MGSRVVPRNVPWAVPSPGVDVSSGGGIFGNMDVSSDGPSGTGGTGDWPAAPGSVGIAAGKGLEVGLASLVPAGENGVKAFNLKN